MLFPAAAYFFADIKRNEAMALLSQRWHTTPGRVQSSEVVDRHARYFGLFRLAVSYTYDVAGRRYQGDTVAFAPKFWNDGDVVRTLAQKYRVGSTAEVHYDPDKPGLAVLETSDLFAAQRASTMWGLLIVPFMAPALLLLRDLLLQ